MLFCLSLILIKEQLFVVGAGKSTLGNLLLGKIKDGPFVVSARMVSNNASYLLIIHFIIIIQERIDEI